ncbi:amino acid lyase [Bacteroidia bacterium]|nr:amino acid lyase [Bacteroidia bacterium]
MINFQCDYVEGAHPQILKALSDTNFVQQPGYGNDEYCARAIEKIKKACKREDVDVHFLVGGTQTNLTVISSILRPHQGVISADEGHINCHETGAIEATGHRVIALPSGDGTITAGQVKEVLENHYNSDIKEHTVQPGMVYISFPTESGTLYSKKQLTDLSQVCRAYGVPLFLDGARLGYGLTSPGNDLTLEEIARLCDVFYIGGTKCGALLGEAVVISAENLKKDFRYFMKQRGGLLAKGRLLGIQFDVLLEDNLYFDICKNAVQQALEIRKAFEKKGIAMQGNSFTNQQFPVLNDDQLNCLKQNFLYEVWGKADNGHTIVRFCTSWATKRENVDLLIQTIEENL